MNSIILGLNSDIAKNISGRLVGDGWRVFGTSRSTCDFTDKRSIDKSYELIGMAWDLLIFAVGALEPIGKFQSIEADDWDRCVMVNTLGPLRMFRHLLTHANAGASAVFFSGTNPTKRNPLYSAYSSSKAMLVRAVEEIDGEVKPKCFVLAPGFVRTKIHASHDVASRQDGTSHEDIYACLKHCMSRPKEEIGGRVVHVPTWLTVWKEMN